jgi:hypothetical protein
MRRDHQIRYPARAVVCALACLFAAASASAQVVADAGDDLALECAAPGTDVTLDGTASTVDGGPAAANVDTVFQWMAAGIAFDDDTSPTPTGSFLLGATTVTLTVTHTNPLTGVVEIGVDSVDVTIEDTTPPTLSVLANPMYLWPPNHELYEIDIALLVDDACDPDPDVVLTSLVSNEPDNDTGDGNTVDDVQEADLGTDDRGFLLRSERKGAGSGRSYTATYTATDDSGNLTNAVAQVLVPHDQRDMKAAKKAAKAAKKAIKMAEKAAKKAAKAAAKAAKKAAKEAAKAAKKAAKEAEKAARQAGGES